jgi:hypothetical protein
VCVCVFIYIYIYREREREFYTTNSTHEFKMVKAEILCLVATFLVLKGPAADATDALHPVMKKISFFSFFRVM